MRKPLAVSTEVAAAVAAGTALAAAAFGPLHFQILGAPVSVRSLMRPIVAATLLTAIRVWLASAPGPGGIERRGGVAWLSSVPFVASRLGLGALIVASAIGWIVFLSPSVGGADSYGYVSAANRILARQLIQPEPLAALLPFPEGIAAATPLGYVPAGRVANATVPAYPLGLSLIMAMATVLAGSSAAAWVAPIAAIVLLVATAVTARAWCGDDEIALLSVTLVAINPLVFTYAIQPMSDVPAAAALMAAVAGLSVRNCRPIGAGLAAALALGIRPALAPALAALSLIPVVGAKRRDLPAAAKYLALLAIGALAQAWSQWYLYGDPLGSGYGSIRGLFSWTMVAINAAIYGHWTVAALGPVWLAATAVGLAVLRDRRPPLVLAAVGGGVLLPYLFYRPYDHWETLRFLLPVVVVATVIAAAGITLAARRAWGRPIASLGSAAIAIALASAWLSWITANQVLTMPMHEARHQIAGELVRQATAPDAVVLALQHSGSLRYYTDRQTLNWERIPTGALEPTVRALQKHGHHVYVMIDSEAERLMFDARHGPVLSTANWLPNGQRRNVQLFEARSLSPLPAQ